ncbi:MAG: alkaline phosphatase family protein [Planctomycetota bacterium]
MIRNFLFPVLISFCLIGEPTSADAKSPKVLMIGIDGLRGDALRKAETPHLDRLIQDGVVDYATKVVSADVTQSDTVSGPGWTTFLTGTWADRHGVLDNSFDGRDRDAAPHCFHLIKEAQPKMRTASFVNWIPINTHVTTDADVHVGVLPPPKSDGNESKDYAAADKRIATLAADVLANDPVDVVFAYFGAVDESGHANGFHPSVPTYVSQIEVVDEHVGQLWSAVRSRASYAEEDWIVVVSSDHGGEGTGHGGGRQKAVVLQVPMIVSGEAAAAGEGIGREAATVDVVAVVLKHLGVEGKSVDHLAGSADGWLGR